MAVTVIPQPYIQGFRIAVIPPCPKRREDRPKVFKDLVRQDKPVAFRTPRETKLIAGYKRRARQLTL
jgi:hypothetical protein